MLHAKLLAALQDEADVRRKRKIKSLRRRNTTEEMYLNPSVITREVSTVLGRYTRVLRVSLRTRFHIHSTAAGAGTMSSTLRLCSSRRNQCDKPS